MAEVAVEDGKQQPGVPLPRRLPGQVYWAPIGTGPDDSGWTPLGLTAETGYLIEDELDEPLGCWGGGEITVTATLKPRSLAILAGIPLAEATPAPRARCVAFSGGGHRIRYARRRPRGYWD